MRLSPSPAVLALFLLASPAISLESPPSAERLLGQVLSALGGEERLAAIEARRVEGTIELSRFKGTYRLWTQTGNKLRLELDLDVIRTERRFDGNAGWEERNGTAKTLEGAALERLRRQALFAPLLTYSQTGEAMEVVGRERVEEREAWVLEITPENGSLERFFIDTETYLPIREARTVPTDDGDAEEVLTHGDYRSVEGLMLPHSTVIERLGQVDKLTLSSIRFDVPRPDEFFQDPKLAFADAPYEITLATIPRRVFKENDGVWQAGGSESWVFHVVVDEEHRRPVEAVSAVLEQFHEGTRVERRKLSREALDERRAVSFTNLAAQRELFDLRHYQSAPVASEIDRLVYRLRLLTPAGDEIEKSLEIPLERYEQKTRLIFPLRGKFMVAAGHAAGEDHKGEWSQHYADDIVALGEHYELIRGSGTRNEDFSSWGAEIVAPAAGTVVYARNDVPDNPRPSEVDRDGLRRLPDLRNAIGGNNVIVDHGNGEFSFLAHMSQGSVAVHTGDEVRQGQVLGRLGNSGNSDGPHLHYQLMAGPELMRSDGLPAHFDNVFLELFAQPGSEIPMPRPKRGIPLVARSGED